MKVIYYSEGKWIPVKDISKPLTSSEFGMGSGVHRPFVGPNEELRLMTNQAKQQQQMILELQKQIDNLTVIQQQQKFLEEELKRRKQAQVAQVSTAKGAASTRVPSKNAEMISMNDSSSFCASDQLNSRRAESVQQCYQKRIITRSNDEVAANAEQPRQLIKVSRTNRMDKSEGLSFKKKQVRLSKRVKRCNSADDKDPAVRGKSKTYPCSECGKAFTGKGNLITHLRIHTGEKPFKCQVCNADFNQKPHLSQHLLMHTNEKPFACDVCLKQFRHKNTLWDHMNVHSGRKPHKCDVCKKTFRQRSRLSIHRKVHV